MDYMPLPPEDCSLPGGDPDAPDPEFEFTKVECLLYAFHTVGKQSPGFLVDNPDRLKDFRSRLQYFARGVQGYVKRLREFLANSPKRSASDDIRVKSTALRCTLNIQALIRDLFHSPPSYKAKIVVSWKTKGVGPTTTTEAGKKRHSISFAPGTAKATRRAPSSSSTGGGSVYQPPTGKYSSKFGY